MHIEERDQSAQDAEHRALHRAAQLPQIMHHAFIEGVEKAARILERTVDARLSAMSLRVASARKRIKRARDYNKTSVHSMVGAALAAQGDQRMLQLAASISPRNKILRPKRKSFGSGQDPDMEATRQIEMGVPSARRPTLTVLTESLAAPAPRNAASPSRSPRSRNKWSGGSRRRHSTLGGTLDMAVANGALRKSSATGPRKRRNSMPVSMSTMLPPPLEREADLGSAASSDDDDDDQADDEDGSEQEGFVANRSHMGSIVWVPKVKAWGTIRYYGRLPGGSPRGGDGIKERRSKGGGKVASTSGKPWLGIALSLPKGSGDGTVAGRTIFPCKRRHGIFVRPHAVREHPEEGDPRRRRKRALRSLRSAAALKKTLARMVARHKRDRSKASFVRDTEEEGLRTAKPVHGPPFTNNSENGRDSFHLSR